MGTAAGPPVLGLPKKTRPNHNPLVTDTEARNGSHPASEVKRLPSLSVVRPSGELVRGLSGAIVVSDILGFAGLKRRGET